MPAEQDIVELLVTVCYGIDYRVKSWFRTPLLKYAGTLLCSQLRKLFAPSRGKVLQASKSTSVPLSSCKPLSVYWIGPLANCMFECIIAVVARQNEEEAVAIAAAGF